MTDLHSPSQQNTGSPGRNAPHLSAHNDSRTLPGALSISLSPDVVETVVSVSVDGRGLAVSEALAGITDITFARLLVQLHNKGDL